MLARVVLFLHFFILLVLVLDGSPRPISATSAARLNEETYHPFADGAILPHGLEEFTKNNAPSSELSSADFCHSCLETARKLTREVLGDPTFFKEISNFVTTFCSSQVQCKNTAIIFLQEGLLGEKLCNTMEFCPENGQESSLSTGGKMGLLSAIDHLSGILTRVQEGSPVIRKVARLLGRSGNDQIHLQSNQTSCDACLHLLDKLRTELEDPDKQMKIIASLLKACENEVSVYRCKKLVFLYAPMVIADLREIVSVDLCHLLHICNKDPAPETRHS